MNAITVISVLAACTVLGTAGAHSQEDPAVLLSIAMLVQQLSYQAAGSSDETRGLFEEGGQKIAALERAVRDNDTGSAKQSFDQALAIFDEISRQLETDAGTGGADLSGDLQRLEDYVGSLRAAAWNHNAPIDFSGIDGLLAEAWRQIDAGRPAQAAQTIQQIKDLAAEINASLSDDASAQKSMRIREYVLEYLDRLEVLVDEAENSGTDADRRETEGRSGGGLGDVCGGKCPAGCRQA